MNTNILCFNHPDFGQVRVITNRKGKPLFVAEDVAKALGYLRTENAISSFCKGGSVLPISTPNGTKEVKFIKKRDLCRLVVGSNFPQAEEFRCWVEDAIVPFVRAMSELVVDVESVLNSVVSILQEVEEEENNRIIFEEEQECDRAKIVFADAVIASMDNMLIDDLATMLRLNGVDIDEDGLLRWMRENDYLCTSEKRRNQPTPKAMELGLFEINYTRTVCCGHSARTVTVKVTGIGQIYFVNKFLG